MPIIRLELITAEGEPQLEARVLQTLADELGAYFGSDAAATWVSVSYLPRSGYAENNATLPETARPALVRILRYELPERDQLAADARALAEIIANRLARPVDNIHLVFEPAGKGRVAFGGSLAA